MSSVLDVRQSSSSSSSSTSLSFSKSRTRKWSREELLKNLSILGHLSAPPEPELPPSPPASRSTSPVPGSKRKSSAIDLDHSKRPRISGFPDRSAHQRGPPPSVSHQSRPLSNTNFNIRSEPSEDGEVREDLSMPSSRLLPAAAVLATSVPIRRPRRERPGPAHFHELYSKYYEMGRALKYSGDARFWSTYPPGHKEYRPLLNPPPPNSPYHKYGGLIARLELAEALVCFTYSIWTKEYERQGCVSETWRTAQAFLGWCKGKWLTLDTVGERERAFQGLIYMIESFIHARMFVHEANVSSAATTRLWDSTKELMFAAAREENLKAASNLLPIGSHLTPQGLPSPANSNLTNSAHSTPTNLTDRTHHNISPNPSASARPLPQSSINQKFPFAADPDFPRAADGGNPTNEMMLAASKITVPVSCLFILAAQQQTQGITAASWCMQNAQKTLTLPIMAKNFPKTFARMMYSSLGADEEYQPDIEDDEGELFWPGQCEPGQGLGWVCLMGKAMIHELGKEIGYMGLKGIIPKPNADAQFGASKGPPAR